MKPSLDVSPTKKIRVSDHLNNFKKFRNKGSTIVTYNSKKACRYLKTPQAILKAVQELESIKLEGNKFRERARKLWFLERLIREARIFENGSFLLKDPTLERFAPILHVGWGMDMICDTGFDFSRFIEVLGSSANPKYRLLAIEAIGTVYVAAQHPFLSSLFGIRSPSFQARDSFESFFNHFTDSEIQYISHGFGRGTYFQIFSLGQAFQSVLNCPRFFDPLYAVKGLGFAYAMVNGSDLDKVIKTLEDLNEKNGDREDIRYFEEGIQSALSFMEWNFPGLLESQITHPIIEGANEMIKSYHSAGGVYSF